MKLISLITSILLVSSPSFSAILDLVSTQAETEITVRTSDDAQGNIYIDIDVPAAINKDGVLKKLPKALYLYDQVPGMFDVEDLQDSMVQVLQGGKILERTGVKSVSGEATIYPMTALGEVHPMIQQLGITEFYVTAERHSEVLASGNQVAVATYRVLLRDLLGNQENFNKFYLGELSLKFQSYAEDDQVEGAFEPSTRESVVTLDSVQASMSNPNSICQFSLKGLPN